MGSGPETPKPLGDGGPEARRFGEVSDEGPDASGAGTRRGSSHEFEPDDISQSEPGAAKGPKVPAEFHFLGPARGEGELGWLGPYRVRRLIGLGGMGLVFLAEDAELNREVALKVLRPELATTAVAAERFAREAKLAAAITHDHVITIYQVGHAGDVAFIAMEHLRGVSLQRWLDRGRKASVDFVLRLGREVATGLGAAHKIGLVHRDVKPANIWLEAPHGRVKLLDFGHARNLAEDVHLTRDGTILGTPTYMSPEQARGEPPDTSSDLFSLGCVLYRTWTGTLPFRGRTILGVLTALATHTPTLPSTVEPGRSALLDDLIMSLLAKDPADRPKSAQAVVEAIRTLEARLVNDRQAEELGSAMVSTPSSKPASTPEVVPPPRSSAPVPVEEPERRSRTRIVRWAAAGALAACLIVLVGFLLARPSSRDDRPRPTPPEALALLGQDEPLPSPELRAIPSESPEADPVSDRPPVEPDPDLDPSPDVPEALGSGVSVGGSTGADPDPPVEAMPIESEAPEPIASSRPFIGPPPPPVEPEPRMVVWGDFTDPDGDCKFALETPAGPATLAVPGRQPHLLSAERDKVNAPRVLRPVRGDFSATVRVLGTDAPSARTTTRQYDPYHGAGLLIWEDKSNYVRLEIATVIVRGRPRHYANYEYRKGGKLVATAGLNIPAGTTFVRLERRGAVFHGSYGPDGEHWTPADVLNVEFPEVVDVGLTAINTASNTLIARFEDYEVRTGADAAKTAADVLVEVEPARAEFAAGDPVEIRVSISNDSDMSVTLPGAPDSSRNFRLVLLDDSNRPLPARPSGTSRSPSADAAVIPSGVTLTEKVRVDELYDLPTPGTYTIVAEVFVRPAGLPVAIARSEPAAFAIVADGTSTGSGAEGQAPK